MKIIAVSRPVVGPLSELAPYLLDEARAVWAHYAEGVFREQYLRDDGGVVIMLEAPSVEAAREVLGGLPLVANGFLDFDVWSLLPFTPWGRLLAG
jgi:hypothetical protein